MKIIRAPVAAAALWLPLCSAGGAHADAAQANYVNQLQTRGMPGTSDQMLTNGYTTCAENAYS